jgi:hypothetical protein
MGGDIFFEVKAVDIRWPQLNWTEESDPICKKKLGSKNI